MNQPEVIQPGSWTFFDKIYCISIDKRVDRRKQAKEQFSNQGILERVEFVIVSKHPIKQEKGIFQSHMKCLKMGLKAGARNILIFEDDVFFKGVDLLNLHRACNYLKTVPLWNGLFLGCITNGSNRTSEKNLVKINYRCLAHAYALNQSFAEKIVNNDWCGKPFDELLQDNNEEFFALYPMCAFQGLAGTDNQTMTIDRIRRLFGGLPFIQKVNELYHNHTKPLLSITLGIFIGFALLVYRVW